MGRTHNNADIAGKVAENAELLTTLRRLDPAIQVRSLMREKGLLSGDLAERVGVSKECISRWLKGKANIQIDSLYRLADALDEPLTILFGSHEQLLQADGAEQSDICSNSDVNADDGMTLLVPKYVTKYDLISLRHQVAANDDDILIEKQETYEPVLAHA
ncbi:helix-turn-helix transcriptional regulator [Paraburkholderia bryophila]|uniref:helix-turn-helix domain-containing protein n=1 Tax=Paraburkholderia bryophila TaxID=420952 RepID=UPI0038BB8269